MLICRVSVLICRAQNSDWSVATVTFYCSSKANHLSSKARVTTSTICSNSSSVRVTSVSRPSLVARIFFNWPIIRSPVYFVPHRESIPYAARPSMPRSCCDSYSTPFSVSLPHPSISLVVSSGVVFLALVPAMSYVPDLKPSFQCGGQVAIRRSIFSSATIYNSDTHVGSLHPWICTLCIVT